MAKAARNCGRTLPKTTSLYWGWQSTLAALLSVGFLATSSLAMKKMVPMDSRPLSSSSSNNEEFHTHHSIPDMDDKVRNLLHCDDVLSSLALRASTRKSQESFPLPSSPRRLVDAIIPPSEGKDDRSLLSDAVYSCPNIEWSQVGNDLLGDEERVQFGYVLALSADGQTLAVVIKYTNEIHMNTGPSKIRVYNQDASDPIGWVQIGGDLVAPDDELFSEGSMDLSDDGTLLAIGIHTVDAVQVYQRNETAPLGWSQFGQTISARTTTGRVALSGNGDILATSEGDITLTGIGTNVGRLFIYQKPSLPSESWVEIQRIEGTAQQGFFAENMVLSSSGDTVAACGRLENSIEAVHVYRKNATTGSWDQYGQTLYGREPSVQFFGFQYSLALSDDGEILAVGASEGDTNELSYTGYVRIFSKAPSGNWTQIGGDIEGDKARDFAGKHIALSSDGDKVVIGGSSTYGIQAYSRNTTSTLGWQQVGRRLESPGHTHNKAFDLSGNGELLAVCDHDHSANGLYRGKVEVYRACPPVSFSPLIVQNIFHLIRSASLSRVFSPFSFLFFQQHFIE